MNVVPDLTDVHKDETIFILGAGPSLHFESLDFLEKYTVITTNASLLAYPKCDYFLADDWDVSNWSYYSLTLPKLECKALLYKAKLENFANHIDDKRIFWYDHLQWGKGDISSLDFSKQGPIVGARTSVGSAIHIAHIMGCKRIVLLGCDCCLYKGKRYFWEFEGRPKPYRLDRKPLEKKTIKRIKGEQVDRHSMEFLEYWKHFANAAKSQGITVLNASGGILEAFDRISLDDIRKER